MSGDYLSDNINHINRNRPAREVFGDQQVEANADSADDRSRNQLDTQPFDDEIYCNITEQVAPLRTIFWLYLQRKVQKKILKTKTRRKTEIKGGSAKVVAASKQQPKLAEGKRNRHKFPSNSSQDDGTAESRRIRKLRREQRKRDQKSEAILSAVFLILLGVTTYLFRHSGVLTRLAIFNPSRMRPPPSPVEHQPSIFTAPIPVLKEHALYIAKQIAAAVEKINQRLNDTETWTRFSKDTQKQSDDKTKDPGKANKSKTGKKKPRNVHRDEPAAGKPSKTGDEESFKWERGILDDGGTDSDHQWSKDGPVSEEPGGKSDWLHDIGVNDLVDTLTSMPYSPAGMVLKGTAANWMKLLWNFVTGWLGFSLHYLWGYV